ncbi:beta-carotene ketolase [Sphingomonas ginkgonis]|uniref:Beta-carotene ketolase n=1 Tax=Sphingomonas ginkgonis TaxID=2315330 RepID=A0A3R9YP79_9SPHN|nr:fatty acid desaturase [Sphingomonas ginkgonis]RST32228.1 beta-carotene ketolase [Sphingomonas ginkgonis]
MTSLARNTATSLLLAGAIGAGWVAIHLGGIFLWRWQWSTAPLAALLIVAQTWLSTGLFIIAHDCMHGSLAPGHPRLNRMIGTLSLAAYAGLSFGALRPKHHAHHRAPGTPDDPDFSPGEPRRAFPWFVRFFSTYYTHGQILRITLAATLYLWLGAALVNIVAFWAIPALLALVQLFLFGTYLPHRHEDGAFEDEHNARSNEWRPLTSLLTCFHFGAYHHEHHLAPGAPWWQLPRVRADRRARR